MACWVMASLRRAPKYPDDIERIADEAKLTSLLAADYEIAKAKTARHKPRSFPQGHPSDALSMPVTGIKSDN